MFQVAERPAVQDRRRQMSRLAAGFFLGMAALVSKAINRDLVTTLTFLSIARANLRDLTTDPARAVLYGGADTIPPDSQRRPVSVYAIARELGLPYETVRRHSMKLRDAGMCDVTPAGLVIPARAFFTPGFQQAMVDNYRAVVAFVNAAADYGIVAPLPHGVVESDVRRQTVRFTIDFFLEGLALISRAADLEPLNAMVFRAIASANTLRLGRNEALAANFAGLAQGPPDSLRDPVSVYAVAKSLNLPYETTRRHVLRLAELDLVERAPDGGFTVPTRVAERPDLVEGVGAFSDLAEVFLARVARYGVVPGIKAEG